MSLLPGLTIVLKVLGALVSFVSGLTALKFSTRRGNKLTTFGRCVFIALLFGLFCSAGGAALEWMIKQRDEARTKARMDALLHEAQFGHYTTTQDAIVSLTISLDKNLAALKALAPKLDEALAYAKSHCRVPGREAPCKDYVIRSVIIDELRFRPNSELFPSRIGNAEANRILSSLSVIVRFYNEKFQPGMALDDNTIGALILNQNDLISVQTLFEWDGARLRVFVDGKLPPDAFKAAGVLSIVDLLGKGATARIAAWGKDVCPKEAYEQDCAEYLLTLFKATNVEVVEFRFPHRRDIILFGTEDSMAEDQFGVRFIFRNFPGEIGEIGDRP